MNSENSKTSEPHLLIINLTDKINLQRGEKSNAVSKLLCMGKHKKLILRQ